MGQQWSILYFIEGLVTRKNRIPNISKTFPNISKYFQIFPVISKYSIIFKLFQTFSKNFQNIFKLFLKHFPEGCPNISTSDQRLVFYCTREWQSTITKFFSCLFKHKMYKNVAKITERKNCRNLLHFFLWEKMDTAVLSRTLHRAHFIA